VIYWLVGAGLFNLSVNIKYLGEPAPTKIEVLCWQNDEFSLYHLRAEIPVKFGETCGYEYIKKSVFIPELDVEMLAECMKHPNSLAAAKEWRKRWQRL
jgi:hypothetical protein